MFINKKKALGLCLFLIFVFVGLAADDGFFSILLVIFTYAYIGYLVEKKSSVHMMFYLGYSTFIFLPCLLNWYYRNTSTQLFFITSLAAAFFLYLTRSTQVNFFIDYGRRPKVVFIFLCCISTFLVALGFGENVSPIFSFLIVLLSLSFNQNKFKNNLFFLLLFLFFFGIYALYGWSGFGRTVLVGWLMLALLQFAYSVNLSFNKYILGLFPALAATLFSGRDFLKLKFTGFEYALNDSAYGPYRLASSFMNEFYVRGYDFYGFLDQVIFTVFVYIPRSIWSGKPNGFGFEYTIRHLEDSHIEAGHSIAATLIGEHIYFLGYLGFFTSLFALLVIAWIVNFLYRIKGLNGNGVLPLSASMMVLVWGGMTSFSARIALPSIVFITLYALLNKFLTRRVRFLQGV